MQRACLCRHSTVDLGARSCYRPPLNELGPRHSPSLDSLPIISCRQTPSSTRPSIRDPRSASPTPTLDRRPDSAQAAARLSVHDPPRVAQLGVGPSQRHQLTGPLPPPPGRPCWRGTASPQSAPGPAGRRNTMPPKRPSDAGDGPPDGVSVPKVKLARLERGPEDFSNVVKNKLQSYTRTGQACDRCKVRACVRVWFGGGGVGDGGGGGVGGVGGGGGGHDCPVLASSRSWTSITCLCNAGIEAWATSARAAMVD